MAFSDTIKNVRMHTLMTQEIFAKEIHSSVASINRWENDRGKPNISTMKNIKIFCSKHSISYDEIEKEWLDMPDSNTLRGGKNGI